jgi:hypothetical protein
MSTLVQICFPKEAGMKEKNEERKHKNMNKTFDTEAIPIGLCRIQKKLQIFPYFNLRTTCDFFFNISN